MRAILTYHSIDESGSVISRRSEVFRQHVRWLASGRVRVVDLPTLIALPDTEDAVAVTFDDGFRNFREQALPHLLEHGLASTVFVVAGRVGETNAWSGSADPDMPVLPLLDWSEIGALATDGVVIGSHSLTHARLPRLDPRRLEDEVSGSADLIEHRAGVRPKAFAYPYGDVDARTADAVAAVYDVACTTEFRAIAAGVERTRLPRLDAFYFDDYCPLEAWGTPPFLRFLDRRRRLRQARAAVRTWRTGC
jgi:peptidoglycan/xylan/chitin deacetylase (PgdA/CDA1 family)